MSEFLTQDTSGRSVAVLGDHGKIVDLVTGRVTGSLEIPPYQTGGDRVRGAALDASLMSSDGRFLINVGNLTSIWDAATGRRIKELVGVYRDDNAASSRMITLSDGQVYVWDIGTWSRIGIVRSANNRITAVRLSRDGHRLITGTDAGAVELWDVETGINLIRLGSLDAPISVVAPDDRDLRILAGSDTGELKIWAVLPELLPTEELGPWITATTGSALLEGSEQVRGLSADSWGDRRDEVVGRLDELLRSADSRERVPLASAILRLSPSHPAAIEVLMQSIEAADRPLSARARAALSSADPTSEGFHRAVSARIVGGRVNDAIVAIISRLGLESLSLIEPLLFEGKGLDTQVRANLVASMKPTGAAAVDLLARAVVDPEPLVRITAGDLLRGLGADAQPAIPEMVRAIGMDDHDARLAVSRSLRALGAIAIPELTRAVQESPQPDTRLNAIVLLGQMNRQAKAAIPALVRVAVAGLDRDLRSRAVDALMAIDSVENSGVLFFGRDLFTGAESLPLLRADLEAEDVETRVRCSEVLVMMSAHGGLGESPINELIAKALSDASDRVRDNAALAAVNGLGDAKPDPAVLASFVKLLKHSDPKTRERAIMAIWEVGPPLAPWARELIEARFDEETVIIIFAGHTLNNIGAAAVPYLIKCLVDPVDRIRAEAADWIGQLADGPESAAPALAGSLDDPIEAVRLEASEALVDLGSNPAPLVPTLLNLLRASNVPEHRARAAEALHKVADPAAEPIHRALTSVLDDPSPKVRYAAADSLLTAGAAKERSINTLIDLLSPKAGDGDTSASAAARLGSLGDDARRAIPELRWAVSAFPKSYDSNLRMSFVRALKDLNAIDELIDILDKEPEVSSFYFEIVGDIKELLAGHPDRLTRIVGLLTHKDNEIREYAAGLLASLGPGARPALPALEKATSDPSASVRSAAIKALNEIRAE